MGMNVHVGWGLVHAAERGRAGVVGLVGHDGILRIQRKATLCSKIGGWTSGIVDGRSLGQTGTSAAAHAGVLIATGWGLGSRRQAESGELIARQQRSFGRVVVVPGNISRTAGVDLRNRRQLQLFGFTGEHWRRVGRGRGRC